MLDSLATLYAEAFPLSERRDISQLRHLICSQPAMSLNALICDGEFAGLFVYWNLEEFWYLEHLAVFPEMRNKKIGQQLLDWVEKHLHGVRLLEVEPAGEEITTRRINYYRRNGYEVLDKTYRQPSYRDMEDSFPLWIMGNDVTIPIDVLNRYIGKIKEIVYYAPQQIS